MGYNCDPSLNLPLTVKLLEIIGRRCNVVISERRENRNMIKAVTTQLLQDKKKKRREKGITIKTSEIEIYYPFNNNNRKKGYLRKLTRDT